MKQFLISLTSRKFLLALSGFIAAVAVGNIAAATAVVIGYLGANSYTSGSGNTPTK